ncbi:disintegrin and metalloproteinase domain-containing protein 20-like [Cygnus atratus]|uniref:disintegrin and metalloproteinase domain-containing protein 20-like n=1 Tax=Cygnus atratus TaxID=8868 RepID=UPI0015D59C1E|nr:disintegrin and metalloproteinase domain-containing protein 20-like [Cygnus atratus]
MWQQWKAGLSFSLTAAMDIFKIDLHSSLQGTSCEVPALPWPPIEHLEGDRIEMAVQGLAEPSPRCLTSILKAVVVRWLQAGHGGRAKALLLRLGVWAALAAPLLPGAGSHRLPPGYAVHEIIRPKKLSPVVGRAASGEVSYVIRVEGENRVVHLTQTRGLVVKNLPVITYSPRGRRVVEQPHVPEECYYLGYVEGSPGSLVALSTCSGLRGRLKIGNLSYGIEPVPESLTFQHLLYRRKTTQDKSSTCGLTVEAIQKQPGWMGIKIPSTKQDFSQRLMHTRYVEIFIVVDYQLFYFQGSNETSVMLLVTDTINLSETYYYPLKVRICLIGLEIWTHGNLIRYSLDIQEVLTDFNNWGNIDLSNRMKYDVAHLFTYTDFGLVVGLAYVGSICYPGYQSGVVSHIRRDFITFSIIFTHELGHNLGMEHDKKECVCGKATKCYMTGESLHGAAAFSNCSLQSFLDLLSRGDGECLNNIPEPNRFFYFKHCGNKVIDEGEQCDCGGPQHCRGNPCCYQDCRLKPGAVCSVGQCCQKCRFRAAGYKCRSEVDECDLPEYCNGTSEWCPEDLYMHDGTQCSDDGYCYRGKCATYDKLCRKVFGIEARGAPESCFKEQNTKGDRFGNCGGDGNEVAFVECKPQNALCGRLQCVNVRRIPFLEGSETIIQMPGSEGWCWGTAYRAGVDTPDIGGGLDGTKCGQEKICINKTCTDAVVRTKCDAKVLCQGKGVCNNLEHCHCKAGWAPPYCQFHGLGGSVDSGPPPHLIISTAEAVQNKAFGTAIGIAVPVAIILIALIIAAIKYINVIAAFFTTSSSTEVSETPEGEEQNKEDDDNV